VSQLGFKGDFFVTEDSRQFTDINVSVLHYVEIRVKKGQTFLALNAGYILNLNKSKKKSKAVPVTGREILRIPHCLDNRLADGGEVVSPMHRPHSTHQKHYFSASGTFC
jgi:hypothetical protein